jgi:hypothetical protein
VHYLFEGVKGFQLVNADFEYKSHLASASFPSRIIESTARSSVYVTNGWNLCDLKFVWKR